MSDVPVAEQDPGDDHEPPTCHCCGYAAKDLEKYRGPCTRENLAGEEDGSTLCGICAGTFLSHSVTYPLLYGEDHKLFSSIGWIANMLRDEIRKLAAPRPQLVEGMTSARMREMAVALGDAGYFITHAKLAYEWAEKLSNLEK